MTTMKYTVSLYHCDDEISSQHKYNDKRKALEKYHDCVTSAECANIDRIILFELVGGRRPGLGFGCRPGFVTLKQWRRTWEPPEPEFQVEGYVVHSVRTLNNTTTCQPVTKKYKDFHEHEEDAVAKAKHLAEKWSDGHEGLIVFKAVKHVHRAPVGRTRVVVEDL